MTPVLWILPAAAMAALGGCVVTGGPTESRDFNNTGFDRISAGGGINVVLSQGPFAVRAEGPEGRLDTITIEQDGRELKLGRKSGNWFWFDNGHYVVNVAAPDIVAVRAGGGADIEAGSFRGESMSIDAGGGADIEFTGLNVATLQLAASGGGDIDLSNVQAVNVSMEATGGGNIEAAGTCGDARMSASGGGDVNADDLSCTNVTASSSGGGDIDARASAIANGAASAGGDVRFYGAPTQFTADKSSGGDVSVEGR